MWVDWDGLVVLPRDGWLCPLVQPAAAVVQVVQGGSLYCPLVQPAAATAAAATNNLLQNNAVLIDRCSTISYKWVDWDGMGMGWCLDGFAPLYNLQQLQPTTYSTPRHSIKQHV